MIIAHSKIQYDKWKSYLNGDVSDSSMFILARTYINQIYGMFTFEEIEKLSNKEIFTRFAKEIKPPKE